MKLNRGTLLVESLIALLICGMIVNVCYQIIALDKTQMDIEKLYEERI